MGFLRRWFKSQAQFFFWTYIPIILTFIFGYALDVYFPEVSGDSSSCFTWSHWGWLTGYGIEDHKIYRDTWNDRCCA
jgi:hypothetical protein